MSIGKKESLLGGSMLDDGGDDDDPRTGLVNLADVMLVFACGLMIALVGFYNIDLQEGATQEEASQSAASQEGTSLEGAEAVEGEVQETEMGDVTSGQGFSEVGTLFQDEETGELYVVK